MVEPDLLVIQGSVVSAEHVSRTAEPLNLKQFVRAIDVPVIVGGCSSYQAALHLMRTGAAGRAGRRRAGQPRPPHTCSASAVARPLASPTPGRRACGISTRPASTAM